MTIAELDRIKERVARTHTESPGGDLDDMLDEIRQVLTRSGLFTEITTHKTGSRTHLIEVRAHRASPETTPQRLAVELRRVWLEELRYDDFEGYAIEMADDAVILDFVTGSNAARLYVTGIIVVALT